MKINKIIGEAGQNLAAAALRSYGVEMVEKIGTPVRCIPHPTQRGYYRVIWNEPVAGDHRGILAGGRSVLAETKTILDRNLRWSDFRAHQPAALSEHARLGGLSLIIWVHHSGVYVMSWPIPEFGPGQSLTPERALIINDEALQNEK